MTIFDRPENCDAFEQTLGNAVQRARTRLLSYCVMPNHRRSVGWGHVYQGRFKPFLVASDEHLAAVCRYVERNALRAGLRDRVERWRWSSLWRRQLGDAAFCD